MHKNLLAFFLLLILCQISCRNAEEYFVQEFNKNQSLFDSCVSYIERTYINTNDRSSLARETILVCGNRDLFMPDDYRISDSVLEEQMKKSEINAISIEKDVCTE
jgi:hypothetical protein